MTVLARACAVSRSFGSFLAVDRVDLEVEQGEVVGLLGANGAGKTTVIRLLLGLLAPNLGEVALFGEPPSARTRRRLGYVPQGLGLYDDLTPAENLHFARSVFGTNIGGQDVVVADSRLTVGELPLGRQRQAAFTEALDHDPDLLVLDEPTSGVSPLAAARLWETIRDATDAGAGALVTTHNLEEAEQCDRLVVMAGGRVVAAGTVDHIVGRARSVVVDADEWTAAFAALQRAGIRAALVGTTLRIPSSTATVVRGALGGIGARLQEVPATLEERFLELVAPSAGGSDT
ncbi:MAG TPA: ABC transporter ATP-binding protein [Acidimicrobiales bacterium]|nr:ABC transporter ATP-binding protein [Acidimicrobiales bacterium]